MKISIAWVFDHIDADVAQIDLPELVKRFNETTAEIEGYQKIVTDLTMLSVAQVRSIGSSIGAYSPEWELEVSLDPRHDAQKDQWYLIIKRDKKYDWATSVDVGAQKMMLLPAVYVASAEQKGAWKKQMETTDYVLTVDNKSITHRPDMWGHRGFAREIAAILDLPLTSLDEFLAHHEIITYDHEAPATKEMPFGIKIESEKGCKRFAGLYMPHIAMQPSLLWMMIRLSRIDSRAINAVVDATNYVMFDVSQPIHAFDASLLESKAVEVRWARNKETLELLDDQVLELSSQDLVVSDGSHPVALAGVMGGKKFGVTQQTSAIFIESANFDAATIRRTAQRYKIRTEASARFEKSLDPNQNTEAILRFLKLFEEAKISYTAAGSIHSLGVGIMPLQLTISQSYIDTRLGVPVAPEFVVNTLQKLGFGITQHAQGNDSTYRVVVPTFRSTKDITIPIDIVEEIGRFYGYSSIPFVLPQKKTTVSDNGWVHQIYGIKELLAFGLSMHEIYSYALFDESFLRIMGWDPGDTAQIKDPISENQYRLVTTLLPHLIKAVYENSADYNQLRFFEWGRSWKKEGGDIQEHKLLSGIFYDKKEPINFYDAKALLAQLFDQLHLTVQWQHAGALHDPWFDEDQTAVLLHEGRAIGVAGTVSTSFLKKMTEGHAFMFELDGNFLEQYQRPSHRFVPLAKYPAVERDISVLVPLSLTVDELTRIIQASDNRVVAVTLVDMFQKKEWKDERSLTMRYTMRDATKTMTKSEADTIHAVIIKAVLRAGVTVR